jgi:hypothetical protein
MPGPVYPFQSPTSSGPGEFDFSSNMPLTDKDVAAPDTVTSEFQNITATADPAPVVIENFSGVTFEDMLNAFAYVNQVDNGESGRWQKNADDLVNAARNFGDQLSALETSKEWQGKTSSAAVGNIKNSLATPNALSQGAAALSTLVDVFARTLFEVGWYLYTNAQIYHLDLETWPNQSDKISQAFDSFAQTVMSKIYAPNIQQIASKNPGFSNPSSGDDGSGSGGSDGGSGGSNGGGNQGNNDGLQGLTDGLNKLGKGLGGAGGANGDGLNGLTDGLNKLGKGLGGAGGANGDGLNGLTDGLNKLGQGLGGVGGVNGDGGLGDALNGLNDPGANGVGGVNGDGGLDDALNGLNDPGANGVGGANGDAALNNLLNGLNPGANGLGGANSGGGGNGFGGLGGANSGGGANGAGIGNSGAGSAGSGNSGLGSNASSLGQALGPLGEALGQASSPLQQAMSAAQKGGAQGAGQGLGPEGLDGLPKGEAGAGAGGGGSGSGIGSQAHSTLSPAGAPVAAVSKASGSPLAALSGGATAPLGAPGAGGSGAGGSPGSGGGGQRGPSGKEHKANKTLRRKKNGEVVIGEVDAVVPVIGDDGPEDAEPTQRAPAPAASQTPWQPTVRPPHRTGVEQRGVEVRP